MIEERGHPGSRSIVDIIHISLTMRVQSTEYLRREGLYSEREGERPDREKRMDRKREEKRVKVRLKKGQKCQKPEGVAAVSCRVSEYGRKVPL